MLVYTHRLPLEGKLSAQRTDEVTDAASKFQLLLLHHGCIQRQISLLTFSAAPAVAHTSGVQLLTMIREGLCHRIDRRSEYYLIIYSE